MQHRARSSLLACGLLSAALTAGACASSPDIISFPLVYSPSEKADPSKVAGLAAVPRAPSSSSPRSSTSGR
ncbi:hypothetical protein [Nannocystis pusilla]|uniref:hypothetical protein n=1 Tax=Nannocystis pusilla TaxID=889268 RepID=UPI003B815CEC